MMAINGGSGDEEGHCASPTAMMANTSVSRFLKHPSGKHTVYQVDVRLPLTRQVWVLFKRYRQFVALRQQLKAECRSSTAPRNTPAKRSLTAGVGSGGTHTNHSKTSTAAKSGASMDAKMSAARVAGGAVPVPLSCSGEVMGQTASSEAVRDVLAEFTFPSKIAIAGPTALRTERRRSLNAFLQALVRIRPIPHSVAVFLDILHDNRLGLDQHGNYVQVTRADNILPIPHSPSHQRNPLVISTTEGATADGGAKADVAHPGNHSSGSLSTITVSDGSRSLPPPSPVDVGVGSATPSTFTTGPDGAHDRVRRSQNDLGIRNQEARSDLRSSVGTTAWQGVHSGGVAVMARPSRGSGTVWEAGTWSSSEQDTDEPTDCESDAESGDDDGSGAGQFCKGKEGQESFGDGDGSLPGGGGAPAPADSSKSGQSYGEGDGVSAPSDNVVVGAGQESSTSAISNNNNSDDGKGDDGIDGGPRSSNNGVFNEEVAPSASAPMIPAVDTLAISPAGLSVEKSGAALLRLRGGAGTGQLKGGGGGTDPEETKAEAESEGWSIVAAPEDVSEHDIPRNSASHDVLQEPGGNGSEKAPDEQQGGPGRGDVGGKGGERGVEERNAEMDLDQDERMIQWEFVNGFLEEVVAVVISRQHLNDAIGAEERQRSLRLSEEDRDLRMAELLSLGVDLPKDRLMMLLSYTSISYSGISSASVASYYIKYIGPRGGTFRN